MKLARIFPEKRDYINSKQQKRSLFNHRVYVISKKVDICFLDFFIRLIGLDFHLNKIIITDV